MTAQTFEDRARIGQLIQGRTLCDDLRQTAEEYGDELGDVAVAAGDLAAARDHYQAGLDIAVKLAAADPANTGWQRDLSAMRQRIADLDDRTTGA